MRNGGFAVIVPVKDNLSLTEELLLDLVRDDSHEAIFIIDNGSTPENFAALTTLVGAVPRAALAQMPLAGIHEMWNAGLRSARRRGIKLAAILNNDIRLDPGCLDRLAQVMADSEVGICCPNYDGRPQRGLVDTDMVCGGMYDGSGGIAGFAFMIRTHGYRFPEELKWWYGDQHVLACMLARGYRAVIVTDVRCEHVDGGSKTGDWNSKSMQRQLYADKMRARTMVAR